MKPKPKSASEKAKEIRLGLVAAVKHADSLESMKAITAEMASNLKSLIGDIQSLESALHRALERAATGESWERELERTTTKPLPPPGQKGPHHIDWR
jgi:hypothetical protein